MDIKNLANIGYNTEIFSNFVLNNDSDYYLEAFDFKEIKDTTKNANHYILIYLYFIFILTLCIKSAILFLSSVNQA